MLLVEAGITEPMFSLTNIRRLPLKLIKEVSDKAALTIKYKRNADALAIAQLGVLIYQIGMSFSSNRDASPDDITIKSFLPYPELLERESSKLSTKAQKVLKYLVTHDSIKHRLINVVSKYGILKP
jgi:hypothetical protein